MRRHIARSAVLCTSALIFIAPTKFCSFHLYPPCLNQASWIVPNQCCTSLTGCGPCSQVSPAASSPSMLIQVCSVWTQGRLMAAANWRAHVHAAGPSPAGPSSQPLPDGAPPATPVAVRRFSP